MLAVSVITVSRRLSRSLQRLAATLGDPYRSDEGPGASWLDPGREGEPEP